MQSLRALDDPNDLRRYLALKAERKRIDAELDALAPAIYSALLDEDGSRFETADPTGLPVVLEVRTRRSYEYSPRVQQMEAELKALKSYEQTARIAGCTKATGYVVVSKAPPAPERHPEPLRLAA
jgi:hypothetical protein